MTKFEFIPYKEYVFGETQVHFKIEELRTKVEVGRHTFYIDSINIPLIIEHSKNNFDTICNWYMAKFSGEPISAEQKAIVCNVSVYIMFSWLAKYSRQPVEDWPIKEIDIKSRLTLIMMISYFNREAPAHWKEISAKLADMSITQFIAFYDNWKKVQELF